MKSNYLKVEKERLAKVKLRRWARRIPNNAALVNILNGFPDKPFRRQFYNRIKPLLRFEPVPLEVLDGN